MKTLTVTAHVLTHTEFQIRVPEHVSAEDVLETVNAQYGNGQSVLEISRRLDNKYRKPTLLWVVGVYVAGLCVGFLLGNL